MPNPNEFTVKIESLFGGISPSALVGPEGFYSEAWNIDPFVPSSSGTTYIKRGGLLRPGLPYSSFITLGANEVLRQIIVPDTKITNQFIFYFSTGTIYASSVAFSQQTADEASTPNTLPRGVASLGDGAAFYRNLSATAAPGLDALGAIYYKNGTQLGRYGPVGSSNAYFRDAWYAGEMYSGVTPIFWNKWDGNLYIGNGQAYAGSIAIIKVTSSEATLTTTAGFSLPPGFEINDIDNDGRWLLFAGHQTPSDESTIKVGETGVFVWDTVSERWDDFITLPDAKCTAIQKVNGTPFAFSGGSDSSGGSTRISQLHPLQHKYSEVEIIPSVRPPHHTQTDAIGEWMAFAPDGTDLSVPDLNKSRANIFAYGTPNPKFPKGLHNIVRAPIVEADFGSSDRIGGLKFIQQLDNAKAPRIVYGFVQTGSSIGGIVRSATNSLDALWRSPYINIGQRFRLKKIHFQFDRALGTGTNTITPIVRIDHQSNSVTLTTITSANFGVGTREITIVTDIEAATDMQLELTWTGNNTDILGIVLPIIMTLEKINTP